MDIRIIGAREHNLKNVSVDIPRGKLTVVTGRSGSGKSSLAFDTLFAEGQRRYVECLSAAARQLLDTLRRPDVDRVENLPPALAIAQHKGGALTPRSTVATVTELMDYLRVLYATVGVVHCPVCGREIRRTSAEEMVEAFLAHPERTKLTVLAPVEIDRAAGGYARALESVRAAGYVRARVDGETRELDELDAEAGATVPKRMEAVVDRLVVKEGMRGRLTDSVETAIRMGLGVVGAIVQEPGAEAREEWMSDRNLCLGCGHVFDVLEPADFSFNSARGACPKCDGLGEVAGRDGAAKVCPACGGRRLKPEPLAVRIGETGLGDVLGMTVDEAGRWADGLHIAGARAEAVADVVRAVRERLRFLREVGIGYIGLDRVASTLSGGEWQRIRLASQIGSALTGVLYVLDEPTVGLHPRDTLRLVRTLEELRDRGNTVVVVEHDDDVMRAADCVIEMGPGAGRLGGEVTRRVERRAGDAAADVPETPFRIPEPLPRPGTFLSIRGATVHNLKGVDIDIPLGRLVAVTGVSGSGKSSLLDDVLRPAITAALHGKPLPPTLRGLAGAEAVEKVIDIDQSPIGRAPRSNPSTYLGFFDELRGLLARTPAARARGYDARRFSFNIKGGRCEVCEGNGQTRLEMAFLPDAYVVCPQCGGRRYNRETLEVKFSGMSIADMLDLTVDEAAEAFAAVPKVMRGLRALQDVGLGYIKLGQPAPTLSGGEGQRVKLAAELQRPAEGGGEAPKFPGRGAPRSGFRPSTLYLLDEPTTGLHRTDVAQLLAVLRKLVDKGHSVVVVEHNVDVMRAADWILDLGPDGGEAGGRLVAQGTPEEVARSGTFTGEALARAFRRGGAARRAP